MGAYHIGKLLRKLHWGLQLIFDGSQIRISFLD